MNRCDSSFPDKDKIGALHKDEFILFVEMLHSRDKSAPIANIITAVTMMDVDDDGKLTWEANHFFFFLLFFLLFLLFVEATVLVT